MSRAEHIANLPPHVVADVTVYAVEDGGPADARRAGWACPCATSKAEPFVEGWTGLPQLGDALLVAGDTRRLGFVFSGDGGPEAIREAGVFYLWDGGFVAEARVVGGGALDLPAAFEAGHTGKGCTVPNIGQLTRLAAYAQTRGAVISNVEVFELGGEFEYPRVDISIYGWEPDERDLGFADKAALAAKRLGWLVEDVAKAPCQFMFLAWLDDGS
jgi:hypothetical protein